jgi:predicted metal-dependent HD superfamily phosphohydrolase
MASLDDWRATWAALGGTGDERLWRDLIDRYSEPHRKYHTRQHLDECFARLSEARSEALQPQEIELALWFHDAVYDVRRQDNEQRSADWASAAVLDGGVAPSTADRVHALVMVTRHDAEPEGSDQSILVDVDLSILGADEARFDEYEQQVREEYSWVPGVVFRYKRRGILEEFLRRPRIFRTPRFSERYETRARANLRRSIEKLGG